MRLHVIISFILLAIWMQAAKAAEIVELTQVPCQFLEPEGVDHGYSTTKKADCVALNNKTAQARLTAAGSMTLKAGDYLFRVKNQGVPYVLGFWIREADYDWKNPIDKLTKLSVSGGDIGLGKSRDYAVTLEPGEYVFSCPLNSTPDYTLIIQ